MAVRTVASASAGVEVNEVERAVNKVDRLADIPLSMAKARMGEAVSQAIGTRALKEFGDKGLVSHVTSGEKVPEWLARIYQDPETRRRYALALLEDCADVEVETTVRMKKRANSR